MTKCLIIGSGIVGLITAYELKNSGCDVTIIDKQSAKIIKPMVWGSFKSRMLISVKTAANVINIVDNSRMPMIDKFF